MDNSDGICPTGYCFKAQTLQQWFDALEDIKNSTGLDPNDVAITHISGGINSDWISVVKLKEFDKKPRAKGVVLKN